MKTYKELNLEEKKDLEDVIQEVIKLLPVDNNFFAPEKIDEYGKSILKTKQDYDQDKNDILHIIEEKRKEGLIDKEKAKKMKMAITILFNEFIRISPRKMIELDKQEETRPVELSGQKAIHKVNGKEMIMNVGELYIKIQDTYVKIPEKALYKVMNIPGNEEMQSMQYFIANEDEITYVEEERMKK